MTSSGRLEIEFGSKFSETCTELIDWSSFGLERDAMHGQVFFDGKLVIYEVNDSFTQEDYFYLQFCLLSGECFSTKVKIYSNQDSVDCTPPTEKLIKIDSSHYDSAGKIKVVYEPIYELDSLCQGNFELEITGQPDRGTASIANGHQIIFESDSTFEGTTKIIYLFCSGAGNCVERYLYIEGSSPPIVCLALPQAQNDEFRFDSMQDSTSSDTYSYVLDVLDNDFSCGEINTLEYLGGSSNAEVVVENFGGRLKLLYIVQRAYKGEETIEYQFCDSNTTCSKASAFIKIE